MAIEQWEIDLCKQLEGKNKTQNWEDDLKKDIQPLPQIVKKSEDNTIFMLALLVVLGVAMLYAYDSKSGGTLRSLIVQFMQFIEKPIIHLPKSHDVEIAAIRSDLQKLEAENKSNLDAITSKVNYDSERINLIGILLNENFLIVRNNQNKGHLIFFNRDWTLDQMPRYMQLSDLDKEYLNKFVRSPQ